jgi:hypothetical protein
MFNLSLININELQEVEIVVKYLKELEFELLEFDDNLMKSEAYIKGDYRITFHYGMLEVEEIVVERLT